MTKKNTLSKSKLATLSVAVLFFAGASEVYGQQLPKDTVNTKNIDEVVVLGSRGGGRSKADSPVPVDVFNMKEITESVPQTNLNQILNNIAPSFTSSVQTGADGTDHMDPAQLRGLGPDQSLVLVNGKRRHTSSLINVNGTPGRGNVGTDLNAIPAFALGRIEVLRDGAAAQYGSDAIAGVMNLELRRDTGMLSGQVNFGGYLTKGADDHTKNWDGSQIQVDLNYGVKIGNRGGFANMTFSSSYREPTSRAGVESAPLFNAYNAIEYRAAQSGVVLSDYFNNINNISGANATQLINYIHQYAPQVGYFDSAYLGQILSENSITGLQGLLNQNFTDQEIARRGMNRKDFNMLIGQSKLTNNQFFVNSEIPVSDTWKIYAFGGYSFRDGDSGGFYRRPNQSRTFTAMYPNGFLPHIKTGIQDVSLSVGVKGKLAEWDLDFSNTFGQNGIDFTIANTGNTSMRFDSPATFYAGQLKFLQNTLNLDINRNFDLLSGLNLAFGAEQRHENFQMNPGEPSSYETYDINGLPATLTSVRPTDFFGAALPGGSQVFPGFRPENAVNASRNSYAAYADAALNFTDWLLVDGAVRYENYSDFGNTVNFKVASRIKLADNFNFRFAGSTGFRAPSIHQIYYNTTQTLNVNGVLTETGTFSNDSQVAKLFGIPQLKQETSQSGSAGFTYKIPALNLDITADGYYIKVKDRVLLTGVFARPSGSNLTPAQQQLQQIYDNVGVTNAQFFANAIDTETKGLDVVLSHRYNSGIVKLKNDFALNINQTRKVGPIHASPLLQDAGLEQVYFAENQRIYLEEAVPRTKASLSHTLTVGNFNVYVRNTYYGKVTSPDNIDVNGDGIKDPQEHQIMTDRVITDLTLGYHFNKNVDLTLGASNLFDVYPSKNLPAANLNDQLVYTRATHQFGFFGRNVFARLNFEF